MNTGKKVPGVGENNRPASRRPFRGGSFVATSSVALALTLGLASPADAVVFQTVDSSTDISVMNLQQSNLGNSVLTNPTQLAPGANPYKYVTVNFRPSEDGTYVFGQTYAPVDTIMIVYENGFDPLVPGVGALKGNDDTGEATHRSVLGALAPTVIKCGPNTGYCPQVTLNVTAGKVYTLLVSVYNGSTYNSSFTVPFDFYSNRAGDFRQLSDMRPIDTTDTNLSTDLDFEIRREFKGGVLSLDTANGTYALSFSVHNAADFNDPGSESNRIDQSGVNSTFSGVLRDYNAAPGAMRIINTGVGGMVTFTGENTYSGGTTIDANATFSIGNGGASGSIVGDVENAGALIFNRSNASAYTGVLSGNGSLTKQGTGVLTLSGANSEQSAVDVQGGTLRFIQDDGIGASTSFVTTGNYTTRTGAITEIGSNNSVLDIGGAFTQEAGSLLKVELGAWLAAGRADIIVGSANLAGALEIVGFTPSETPNSSTELTTNDYQLMKATSGTITGMYSGPNLIGADGSGLDYLMISSDLRNGDTELWLGFQLAWTDGGQLYGTGDFTVDVGRFTLDTAVGDQTGFTGGLSNKGWNGRDLTKRGAGILRLAAVNTYTGATTVEDGTLQTMVDNVFASSSAVIINADTNANTAGTFDLNGTSQFARNLSGSGGTVTLGGGTLTAHNATVADSSQYNGTISGDGTFIKTGDGSLTLTGATLWNGQTHLEGGTLVLSGNAAHLISDVIGQDGTHLSLVNGAHLTGTIDPTDVTVDASSVWTMTGTSDVATMDLAGRIEITAPSTMPLTRGRVLTATNWHGQGGTVTLYTTLRNDLSVSDKIVINGGQATGTTSLDIRNAGGLGAKTWSDGIKVVEAANGASTAVDAFSLSGRVAAGAYDYTLFRGDTSGLGDDWYLRSERRDGRLEYRDEVPVAMTVTPLASRLGLDMLGTYDDRRGMRGALSSSNTQQRSGAAWGRTFGKTGDVHSSSFSKQGPSYDMDISGLQAGADLYSRENGVGGRDTLGVYLGIGQTEGKVEKAFDGGRAGKVDLNGYGLGAYWTHQGASGWYTDTVLQGMSYRQGNARSVEGEQFKTSGWGLAASVEAGYPLALAAGWTLEPQAQMVYQVVNLDDGADRFGQIALDDTSVLYGRIGAKLSKTFAPEGGRPLSVWGRMNVWNTFGQDATATFSDLHGNNAVSLSSRLGGTWGQIGAGIAGKISDSAALFAGVDYERSLGAGSGDSIAGRIGVSINW